MFIEKDILIEKNTHIDSVYDDHEIIIHFVGVLNGSNFYDLPMHKNQGYEICIIPSGKGFFKVGDITWPVSLG